jgi:hypothetical protein
MKNVVLFLYEYIILLKYSNALLKPIFETAKIRTLSLPKGLFLDRFLALASLRQAQGPGQRFFSTEQFSNKMENTLAKIEAIRWDSPAIRGRESHKILIG